MGLIIQPHKEKKGDKTMKNIIYGLAFALCIWIGVSFVDIVADNNTKNPQHSDWNIFVMMTEEK